MLGVTADNVQIATITSWQDSQCSVKSLPQGSLGVHEVFLFGSFSLFSGDGDGEGKGEEGREGKSLCHGSSHPTGQGQVTWTKCQLTAKDTGS